MSQSLPPEFMPFEPLGEPTPPPVRKRAGVITLLLTLALVLAVAVLLNESVLKVRHVAVVGNQSIPWEDVVAAAGLSRAKGFFSLNEKEIAAGINANRYLVFERMEKQFPDGVTLYVRERVPVANVQVMGTFYQLDREGMVLERMTAAKPNDGLLIVTGFQAKDVRVGRIAVPATADHLDAYLKLMEEISLQGFADQVSELNLSDPDSLYLVTRDGYTAHLGDRTALRAKIGTVRAVVAKLREMGKTGGMLEASIPAEATYTPMGP